VPRHGRTRVRDVPVAKVHSHSSEPYHHQRRSVRLGLRVLANELVSVEALERG
jgi:hypothetical protein